MSAVRESFTVGQLLTISAEHRPVVVQRLPVPARLALANLAQHGLTRELGRVEQYRALLADLLRPDPPEAEPVCVCGHRVGEHVARSVVEVCERCSCAHPRVEGSP